jgi:hypothetical protein
VKALAHASSTTQRDVEAPHPRNGVFDRAVGETPLVIALACCAAVLFGHLAMQFAADSWLNLLGGRETLEHGLPRHDTLAVLSRGQEWIDQQWLAHLFYYGAYLAGGLSLVARVNVVVFLLAVAGVYWFARSRGASAVAVVLCSVPLLIVGIEFVRAQVLAEPLFVAVLALLASESRRPTKRWAFVFPVLVLWANIHGSVVFGAALVAMLGVVELARGLDGRRSTARAVGLVVLPWLCIFASPYGPSLITYYRATLRNPEFTRHLTEWASPTFGSVWGVLLLASALLTVALVARRPRGLSAFELAAMAFALLAAMQAVRSIVWFVIAVAMLLPELVEGEAHGRDPSRAMTPVQRGVIAAAAGAASLLALLSVARPGPAVANTWPPGAIHAIDRVLRSDPNARVLAGYDLADWVLFDSSQARGRIAYDGRWEILGHEKFLAVMRYLGQETSTWKRVSRGYRVIILRRSSAGSLIRWYAGQPGVTVLYRSSHVVAFDRGRSADPKP